MSKHRCRVLPSNSSRRIYFPPSNEALCPSLGCPSRDEGGPAAELGLHSEGHRGGDRVRGGITVLCIETSCKDCVAGIDIVGTGMLCGPMREEGVRTVDSRGLTLAMGCTEEVLVSGLSEGSVVELVVSSMVTSNTHENTGGGYESISSHLERLYYSLLLTFITREANAMKTLEHLSNF